MNRRTFIAVLGAATAAATIRPAAATSRRVRPMSAAPLCQFSAAPSEPTARPRSMAITYLTLDQA